MPGFASYHLSNNQGCYIDYTGLPYGMVWKLDDGRIIPERKYFKNVVFDAKTRTFSGVIEFDEDAMFIGHTRWDYTMTFSEDWKKIVGGGFD